jgi:serum/glucocorticoid-regulated kinase 2
VQQAADIKAHVFFKGVKWDKMLQLAIAPPFVPDVEGPSSLKYVRPKYLEQVS